MSDVIVITGAGTGIGHHTARSLALAGHTVYAGLGSADAIAAAEAQQFAQEHGVDLRTLELDTASERSTQAAAQRVLTEQGRVDVLVHHAAHLYVGATEAFSPEQILRCMDTNVVGALRVNHAFLPVMRSQRRGLLVWVSGAATGAVPLFLGPYAAAKAAFGSFAESVGAETVRFGIDTTIVAPGALACGTASSPRADFPYRPGVAKQYKRLYQRPFERAELVGRAMRLPGPTPEVRAVAEEIVRVVGLAPGERPLRTSVDYAGPGNALHEAA